MKNSIFYFLTIFITIGFFACKESNVNINNKDDIFWTENNSPEMIGKMVTDDLLSRVDFMMYISAHCTAVHYAEACAAFGAARLAGLMSDSSTIIKLSERYMRVIEDSIVNTANHVDANVYGILPLELYMQTKNEKFFNQGLYLADIQ